MYHFCLWEHCFQWGHAIRWPLPKNKFTVPCFTHVTTKCKQPLCESILIQIQLLFSKHSYQVFLITEPPLLTHFFLKVLLRTRSSISSSIHLLLNFHRFSSSCFVQYWVPLRLSNFHFLGFEFPTLFMQPFQYSSCYTMYLTESAHPNWHFLAHFLGWVT